MRKLFLLLLFVPLLFSACRDKVDESDIYTFTGQTIMDYIRSDSSLSLYAKILERSYQPKSKSSVASLLGTRGNYAVFAPDNNAVRLYLDSVCGNPDYPIDSVSTKTANDIVLNSVIDYGKEKPIGHMSFKTGAQPEGTLNDTHLIMQYGNYGDGCVVKVNGHSRIV